MKISVDIFMDGKLSVMQLILDYYKHFLNDS